MSSTANQGFGNYDQTGTFSSPGLPDGPGPFENEEETLCDILTELISILFKVYSKIWETTEDLKKDEVVDQTLLDEWNGILDLFENIELLHNLQLLLGVKFHNDLLRIVFELVLILIESRPSAIEHFRNLFTMDILLKIFEDYEDKDLKQQAIDILS